MQARELLDEVPDLNHTAARLRHLLIEPKTPGEITTSRLAVQGLEFYCIILNLGFRSGETFADELLRLAPQGACDLVESDFGVVLHAPEHTFALPDLCGLHVGERVRRKQHGAFPIFGTAIFLAIWTASLVSNFGSLIQRVGASWLMTSIAPAADMVAPVQAARSLPIMLFSLLAGAAADVWDRRSVMLVAQVAMLLASAALSLLAYLGLVTPWLLLGLTFLLGCGVALYGPAWQSSVGEQVPRDVLPAAVALNSLGFNIARTVGPAIGGIVVAAAGAQAAFLLNALSYIGLIVVLLTWKRPAAPNPLPPETAGAAMRVGLRCAPL